MCKTAAYEDSNEYVFYWFRLSGCVPAYRMRFKCMVTFNVRVGQLDSVNLTHYKCLENERDHRDEH